jgi:hypothetical protein
MRRPGLAITSPVDWAASPLPEGKKTKARPLYFMAAEQEHMNSVNFIRKKE